MNKRMYLIAAAAAALALSLFFMSCGQGDDDDDDDDTDDDVDDDDDTDDDDDNERDAADLADSGCLDEKQGEFTEELNLNWDGSANISVTHAPLCNNCGFEVNVTYMVEPGVITIYENSQLDYMPMDCMCLFEYSYKLEDIAAGDYQLLLYTRFYENGVEGESFLRFDEDISLPAGSADEIGFSEDHPEGCG